MISARRLLDLAIHRQYMAKPKRNDLPQSRSEAKEIGSSHYFTGLPCKHGHVEKRTTSGGTCLGCMRDRQKQRLATDPVYREKHRVANREYMRKVLSDPAKRRAITDRINELNRASPERRAKRAEADRKRNATDKVKARRREVQRARYRQKLANDPAHIEARKKRSAEWAKNNKDRCNAKTGIRRAKRVQATPPCLTTQDLEDMLVFYNEAQRLSRELGVVHEVDHIVPLNHKRVCGLHVPWNLQVLTQAANRAKANRFEEENACNHCNSADARRGP